jgi:sulfate transport system ATP-binding protein
MTVAKNIAFGLEVRPRHERPAKAEIKRRVEELLELVQLQDLGKRYPSQLSGGQRQRVALARALAIEPRMLLLDEPFGALDSKVRKELRLWLRALHDKMGITTLFVTHDQEEAFAVADLVAVMNQGRIEQYGEPAAVKRAPGTAFVQDFIGAGA